MLESLQKKWKVGGLQLLLILCTFAIGGSLTGYAAKKLMNVLPIEKGWLWIAIYIILVTILWPVSVLLVSVLFGQFPFFMRYLKKIGTRMGIIKRNRLISGISAKPVRIAIFASGAGSNAEKIIQRFAEGSIGIKVVLVMCNKPGAGVLAIAARNDIPSLLIEKERFFKGDGYVDELKKQQIDFIVLAGFLWKIPDLLIGAYRNKIINIHPALLPNYGGKGMYGQFVHEAVIAAGDKESGITIHYVDEKYDHGAVIFQARCPVLKEDTPATLAAKIHQLEHKHYPAMIEKLLRESLAPPQMP